MRPTQSEIDGRWELTVARLARVLLDSADEIEEDEGALLVPRPDLEALVDLLERGQTEEDVELWIWAHAPVVFRRAKRLLRNPLFLMAARGKS